MYLFLSLPIFIINIIFPGLAFYDIWKHYKYATFKPRLILVATVIFADIPYSLLFIFPDMITNGFLTNKAWCYLYTLIAHFYIVKFLGLFALTIFIGLIFSTKYTTARLNRVGWWLNWSLLGMFLFIEFVLIPISGCKPIDLDKSIREFPHPKRCVVASDFFYNGLGYMSLICSLAPLTASIVFLTSNFLTNNFKKGTSSNRISYSFFFFALVNAFAQIEWFAVQIRGKSLDGVAKWVILDIGKIVPTLFAIIYLLTEAYGRLANLNFGIKRILEIKRCRKLFVAHLSEIQARVAYELVDKWGKFTKSNAGSFDVLDRHGLNKQEAITYIEKNLELELYGFLMFEAFNDFYINYNKAGHVEADLAEERDEELMNKG